MPYYWRKKILFLPYLSFETKKKLWVGGVGANMIKIKSTINFVTIDFDYLNYETSTKLKKVNDKNFKPVCNLILKISFLTLFGCAF